MSPPTPSVAVIIPTFNETSRLVRAVESVFAQSSPVQEIFVIADGSSEDTRKFLKAQFGALQHVKLIEIEHSGLPGVARKTGLSLTTAEWIAFLDADDVWLPDKMEKQLHRISETKADLVYGNAFRVENGELELLLPKESVPDFATTRNLIRGNFIANSSVIVRKSALLSIGMYADSPRVRGSEDYATWLRLASSNFKLAGISEPTFEYHVYGSSLCNTTPYSARRRAIWDWMKWITDSSSPFFTKFRNLALGSWAILGEQKNLVRSSVVAWIRRTTTGLK